MSANRVDVGSIRREQIVDAAIAVIAEQGIQHLSLSEIEKKTGMARGQLTYYYKTKEDILLAVFDRLIQLMHQRATASNCPNSQLHTMPHGWERCLRFLDDAGVAAADDAGVLPAAIYVSVADQPPRGFPRTAGETVRRMAQAHGRRFRAELANKKRGRCVAADYSPRWCRRYFTASPSNAPPTRTRMIGRKCSIWSLTYWATIFAHQRRHRPSRSATPQHGNGPMAATTNHTPQRVPS